MDVFLYPAALPLSVILATFRRPDNLWPILDNLVRQVTSVEFEVILVLQGYEPYIRSTIEDRYSNVLRLVFLEYEIGLGLIAARNIGLQHSKGAIITFIEDDIQMQNDWITQIAIRFDQTNIGGVCGYVLHAPGFSRTKLRVFRWLGMDPPIYTIDRYGFVHHPLSNFSAHDRETEWMPGVSSYRREVFETVGLLEERYGYGFEDADLGFRARNAGWHLLLTPDATVQHYPSSLNRMSRLQSAYHIEKVRVLLIGKVLAGKRLWRIRYLIGFAKTFIFQYVIAGMLLHRDARLPFYAIKGAWMGMHIFGHDSN